MRDIIADEDIRVVIAQHDTQLKDTLARLGSVETKTDVILGEMHKLNSLIAAQIARPTFKLGEMLQSIAYIGGITGLIVSAIVYVTNASYSGQLQKFQDTDSYTSERIDSLKDRMNRIEGLMLDPAKKALSP